MEAIGIGDIHLDKLNTLIPNVSELITKSIARAFNYALENGVSNIFFYGDIGERPRLSYESQVALYALLGKKKYRELKLYVILGNHDFAEDGTHTLQVLDTISAWAGIDNLKVFTKRELCSIDGVPFNFLPYPFTDTRKDAINVGHFEVSGSLRDNGRRIDEGLETKHVTLMGHLHTKHRVRNTFYSGTLYQTNFGESLPKFFHHVRLEEGAPVTELEVECVKANPPWKLLNQTITSVRDLETLETEPTTLYKLFLKEGLNVDLNQVLVQHPNVVRHNTFRNKQDLEVLTTREWDFDGETVEAVTSLDEVEIIKAYMSQVGLKKHQVKRGLEILKEIRK